MTLSFDRISLHEMLETLLDDMQEMTSELLTVMIVIGCLALLFEVSRLAVHALSDPGHGLHLERLVRPLLLLLLIVFFPSLVLAPLDGILGGVSSLTSSLVQKHAGEVEELVTERDDLEHERLLENSETAYLVDEVSFDREIEALGWSPSDLATMASMYMERTAYRMKTNLRKSFVEILELLFDGAACLVDVLRCFLLCVLSLLGPLSLALSIFPVFSGSFSSWLARYVQVFLYLPLADIFSLMLSRLEGLLLEKDIEALQTGLEPVFGPASTLYILFLLMGTIGYLAVPYAATYVVRSGGMQEMTSSMGARALLLGHVLFGRGRGEPQAPSTGAAQNDSDTP